MTKQEITEITTVRLEGWKKKIIQAQATPQVLIGVQQTGRLVLVVTEDIPIKAVKAILQKALLEL